MGIGGPGVAEFDPVDLTPTTVRCCGPETEGAVDVEPAAHGTHRLPDRTQRIEGTSVDVAGLGTDDARPLPPGEERAEVVGTHPSLIVHRHPLNPVRTETEHAEGHEDRGVGLLADDHLDLRGTIEAGGLHVPTEIAEHGVPTGGEAHEVRHGPAGDEAEAGIGRQTEEFLEPSAGDLLDHGNRRRGRIVARILVPGRGQPARGHGDGEAPPDDEAEVAGTGARHEARFDRFHEILENPGRIVPLCRKCPAQRRAEYLGSDRHANGPGADSVQVGTAIARPKVEEIAHRGVVHGGPIARHTGQPSVIWRPHPSPGTLPRRSRTVHAVKRAPRLEPKRMIRRRSGKRERPHTGEGRRRGWPSGTSSRAS